MEHPPLEITILIYAEPASFLYKEPVGFARESATWAV
jgi:hypothetical protein